MKKLIILFFILISNFSFSQEQEVFPPFNIKTAAFIQNGNPSIPFFRLGDSFEFQFDDLYGNEADYYYTIEHYNYDWTPSPLLKNEYINGLDNQRIQDYQNSLNCLQIYSHYKISFPNKFNQIIKSGNYILKIFDNDQNLLFSRKFIIYEDQLSVGVTIRRARDNEGRESKHNIEFYIDYKDRVLQNPVQNFKVSIYQNGKFHNAIHNIKPQYTLGSQFIYRYNTETQFWAGNEFWGFENKNIRGVSNSVAKVTAGDIYNTHLYFNQQRKKSIYTYFPDINGNFFITNFNSTDFNIESDYTWVYFTLNTDVNPLLNNIYINGMFNNYALTEENKMEYNSEKKIFEKAILIKQGYTNYQYVITDKNGKIDEKNAVDGNFYQTENDYFILAYYKSPNDRYDRVIGYARNSSTEIKN